MRHSELPKSFWGYALETVVYLLNRVLSKSIEAIPYEMWYGKKPILSYMRIWGCPAYVMYIESDKLEAKSDKCLFVGYPNEIRGYYFYNPTEQKMFVLRHATFLEKDFFIIECNGS